MNERIQAAEVWPSDPPPNYWHSHDCRWFPEANNRHIPLMWPKIYPKWVCAPGCKAKTLEESMHSKREAG